MAKTKAGKKTVTVASWKKVKIGQIKRTVTVYPIKGNEHESLLQKPTPI